LVFTGTYEHTIDTKSRVAIPSDVRALLESPRRKQGGHSLVGSGESDAKGAADDSSDDGSPGVFLYVTLGEGDSLCLYTEEVFEQRARELDSSELDPDELLMFERMMFSLARRVEMDKAGRLRLPEHLLKMVKLGTDVVLLGVKDHLEIRDRAAWNEQVQRELTNRPGLVANPRKFMRKQSRD
jgi:MraZ protein